MRLHDNIGVVTVQKWCYYQITTTEEKIMSIKPFWIEITEDITNAMVAEVFDKAVAQGANLYEGVEKGMTDES